MKCVNCNEPLGRIRPLYKRDDHDCCVNPDCGEYRNLVALSSTRGSGDFSIGGALWPGLSKLIEECGEVMQVGGKLIGSEGDPKHWSGDLNTMLIEELGDLRAAITFFMEANNIDSASVAERQREKLARFWQWHRETMIARSG